MEGGVCIDLTKMEEVEDYHQEDFDVSVRPGVTREEGGISFKVGWRETSNVKELT